MIAKAALLLWNDRKFHHRIIYIFAGEGGEGVEFNKTVIPFQRKQNFYFDAGHIFCDAFSFRSIRMDSHTSGNNFSSRIGGLVVRCWYRTKTDRFKSFCYEFFCNRGAKLFRTAIFCIY